MSQPSRRTSFVYGFIAATLLACAIGAAANNDRGPQYDVTAINGVTLLQIVDHGLNRVYHYQRIEGQQGSTYRLFEKIDISRAGKLELKVDQVGAPE